MSSQRKAVVVGAGPNGLAAAITLAQAGWKVMLVEAGETIGGGTRTDQGTLPGFRHDVCSAIHPLGMGSPYFRTLPLGEHGLEWIQPEIPLAHPLDGGRAAVLHQSLEQTALELGPDGLNYKRLMAPLVKGWDRLAREILAPVLHIPRSPFLLARFGLPSLFPATTLARLLFKSDEAKALFAGLAAHSVLPLEAPGSSAIALVLGILGHKVGWPFPRGGSQAIADSLGSYLISLGGEIETGRALSTMADLPDADAYLFNTSPKQVLEIADDQLPGTYQKRLRRFRYGPGSCKVDWALDGPIPWEAEACRKAGTVHVGGTIEEVALSERHLDSHPADRPYVLVAQQSLYDPTRAPEGKHTGWAYCHVPNGYTEDVSEYITAQVERFAPGFRKRILASRVITAPEYEIYNANYIGGDIAAGSADLWQVIARPVLSPDPYSTPNRSIFLCSASTPPGPGVHGLCGHHAAQSVLRRLS